MRLVKMLGLAVVTALLAVAVLGTSSASAEGLYTALCKEDKALVCPAGQVFTGHIEGLADGAEILSDLADVACDHSVILSNALGLGHEKQVTHVELLDFTGDCLTPGGTACTITTVALGLIDLVKVVAAKGQSTFLGTQFKVVCPGIMSCTFGGEFRASTLPAELPLTTSGTPPSLAKLVIFNGELKNIAGLICPKQALLHATYRIQLPHEVFITE